MTSDPELAFEELTQPVNWAYMASALQRAAALMDWTEKRDITDWRFVPIYRMLMGFSLENLLKGILLAEDPDRIRTIKWHHGLSEYAAQITGLRLTADEKRVLCELEPYVRWAGRYPAPLRPDGMIRIGHSERVHDAEYHLGAKLYAYLQSLSPEIEPLPALLPCIE